MKSRTYVIRYRQATLALVGKQFGRLTVLSLGRDHKGRTLLLTKCSCGNELSVLRANVIAGVTKSCGCLRKEIRNPLAKNRSFRTWKSMIQRCRHMHPRNKHYAMRGIKVCERWEKFENFFSDMGERPEGKSLDRIDPNGNYDPANCIWSDTKAQALHKRGVITMEIGGVVDSISAWARKYNRHPLVVKALIFEAGWTLEEALKIKKRG